MESAANLTTMDRKHDDLIVKVDWDREVTWDEVIHKLRVPKGDVSTAATRMKQAFGIKRRTPRFDCTKPERGATSAPRAGFEQCPYSARTVPVQCPYSARTRRAGFEQCPYILLIEGQGYEKILSLKRGGAGGVTETS